MRNINPISRLRAFLNFWDRINIQEKEPNNKIFLEVGTGSMPLIPLSLWLLGAKKVISIDLYSILKVDLIKASLNYIRENQLEVEKLFGSRLKKERLDNLLGLSKKEDISLHDYCEMTNLKYLAPYDASKIDLPDESIDFHISQAVLEHIPEEVIPSIFKEAKRMLKEDGLAIHCIDYSDNYAKYDIDISYINFLKYKQ